MNCAISPIDGFVPELLESIDHAINNRVSNTPASVTHFLAVVSDRSFNTVQESDNRLESRVDQIRYRLSNTVDKLLDNVHTCGDNTTKGITNTCDNRDNQFSSG